MLDVRSRLFTLRKRCDFPAFATAPFVRWGRKRGRGAARTRRGHGASVKVPHYAAMYRFRFTHSLLHNTLFRPLQPDFVLHISKLSSLKEFEILSLSYYVIIKYVSWPLSFGHSCVKQLFPKIIKRNVINFYICNLIFKLTVTYIYLRSLSSKCNKSNVCSEHGVSWTIVTDNYILCNEYRICYLTAKVFMI